MKPLNLFFQVLVHARGKSGIQTGLLLLAVIALYARSLSAPYVFDDLYLFSNFERLSKYGHGFFNFEMRWLPYASFAQTLNWLGYDRFWLRLGNVLLHAANAIGLFYLLRRLFKVTLGGSLFALRQAQDTDEPSGMPYGLTGFAFFGALIFALHPVAVYGVAYLIQRSTLMATLFVLLMLLAYLEGLQRQSWRWMLTAALCYFAAIYSKEHSIAAPGLALALTLLVRKPSAALFKQIAPFYMMATLIAATMLWSMLSSNAVLGMVYEVNALGMLRQATKLKELTAPTTVLRSGLADPHLLSILTQCGLFFKYLWLWLLPNPAWMSVDMREPFAMSLFGQHTLGLIGFLSYFCVAVWLLLKRGSKGLLGFALLFPWIMFLAEWSTVRIQEPFVLYRSYLWMPGLFFALPLVCGRFAPKKVYIMLGLISVMLVPLTLNRLDTFSSALKLWDDAEKLVRGKTDVLGVDRIYYYRGIELLDLDRFDEAIADFNKVIATTPNITDPYVQRGITYYFQGKYPEALHDFDWVIAFDSDNPQVFYVRALTYRALGNAAAAQEDLRKSCALGGLCK